MRAIAFVLLLGCRTSTEGLCPDASTKEVSPGTSLFPVDSAGGSPRQSGPDLGEERNLPDGPSSADHTDVAVVSGRDVQPIAEAGQGESGSVDTASMATGAHRLSASEWPRCGYASIQPTTQLVPCCEADDNECDRRWELWCRCTDIPGGQSLRCVHVGQGNYGWNWACKAP